MTDKTVLAFLLLNLALLVLSQGTGTRLIADACKSDADCASGCCGFYSGKCAGPIIAQVRDGGCGFGDASPNDIAAMAFFAYQATNTVISTPVTASSFSTTASVDAGASGIPDIVGFDNPAGAGKKNAQQFITGLCTSDADCASACCGFNTGRCAGGVIAQTRDGGCGFGDAMPNDRAAKAFFSSQAAAMAASSIAASSFSATASVGASASARPDVVGFDNPAGAGKKDAQQFITGLCTSDADCASGCCGFNTGKCAGAVIAQTRDGGCGFGDQQPNAIAAMKLGFSG